MVFGNSRCKKKVPATKRFTVHRTSNVLTLSLKRFANFSGGKITKVSRITIRPVCIRIITNDLRWVFFFFWSFPSSGCWLPRVPEHSSIHVSKLRRPSDVWPLCSLGAFWVQLSCWSLLLLC